ncbi:MAG: hypothetical protein HQ566_00025 [Candidatus Omnitrophica bacterium]|nr:hypothetical protein [Candidatus Omnitrophota bacterium]
MVRKGFWLSLLVAIMISLGLFTLRGFGKDQRLENTQDLAAVSEKIEEVLKNQQDIIERLGDIRSQQDIIRVRASRK